MKVNNINGTSGHTCACGSWLEHWKKFSGRALPPYCAVSTCASRPEDGAHVQRDSVLDRHWYIVPLCRRHNLEKGRSLEITTGTVLVPANTAATCGRRS